MCSTISIIIFILWLQVLHHLWFLYFPLQLAFDKRENGLDVLTLMHLHECRPKSRATLVHRGGNISSEQKPQRGADWAPANNAVFPLDFFLQSQKSFWGLERPFYVSCARNIRNFIPSTRNTGTRMKACACWLGPVWEIPLRLGRTPGHFSYLSQFCSPGLMQSCTVLKLQVSVLLKFVSIISDRHTADPYGFILLIETGAICKVLHLNLQLLTSTVYQEKQKTEVKVQSHWILNHDWNTIE